MIPKKAIIIITLAFNVYLGNSQESIPFDSLKYNIGEMHFIAISEYIGFGDSGENVTWDFSTLNKTSVNEIRILAADSIVNEANLISFNFTTNSYLYLFEDSSKRELLARKNGETGEIINYKNTLTNINYPMIYGMEFNDTSLYTNYNSSVEDSAHNISVITKKVDGYGTLTTPLGTFNNVLRVYTKRKDTIKFSTFDIGFEVEIYEWFVSGYSNSLIAVSIVNIDGQLTYSTTYLDDPNLQQIEFDKPSNEIVIYPNPTSDYVNISSNWVNFSVEIYDLTGRNVYEGKDNKIDISELERGLYTVVVTNLDNSITYTQKIIVKK